MDPEVLALVCYIGLSTFEMKDHSFASQKCKDPIEDSGWRTSFLQFQLIRSRNRNFGTEDSEEGKSGLRGNLCTLHSSISFHVFRSG